MADAAAKYTLKVGHNQMERRFASNSQIQKPGREIQRRIQVQVYPANTAMIWRLQALNGNPDASISALPRMASRLPGPGFDLFLFPSYEVPLRWRTAQEKSLWIKGRAQNQGWPFIPDSSNSPPSSHPQTGDSGSRCTMENLHREFSPWMQPRAHRLPEETSSSRRS
jgi:hypothetical protein